MRYHRLPPALIALVGLTLAPLAPATAVDVDTTNATAVTTGTDNGTGSGTESGTGTDSVTFADSTDPHKLLDKVEKESAELAAATTGAGTTGATGGDSGNAATPVTITRTTTVTAPATPTTTTGATGTEPTAENTGAAAESAAPTTVPDSEYDPKATVSTDKEGHILTAPKFVTGGQKITIEGSGWAPRTQLAVKLRHMHEGDRHTQTYARTSGILKHPKSQADDPTLWVLDRTDDNGAFTINLTLPKELVAGQKFLINVATGLNDGEAMATVNTPPLIVDKTPYAGQDDDTECKTDLVSPRYTVAQTPNEDGTLNITGTGWCNPAGGASVIAVKIDEAAISRLESNKVDTNVTIWDFIYPDPATGDFDYNMPLPNGTTEGELGSTPAFGEGAHTLRFLTGSIKDQDPVRSLPYPGDRDTLFVIGEYKPNGLPDPIHESKMTADNNGDMKIREEGNNLVISLPHGRPGDFVYPSGYIQDGSRRLYWYTWSRLDDRNEFRVDKSAIPAKHGEIRLLVQDGNLDTFNTILGWAKYDASHHDLTIAHDDGGYTYQDFRKVLRDSNTISKELITMVKEFDKVGKNALKFAPTESKKTAAGNNVVEVVEVVEEGPAATNQARAAAPAAGPRTGRAQVTPARSGGAATTGTSGGKAATPQPTTTPAPPVKHKGKLTPRNAGGYTAKADGTNLIITTKSNPGDWVYVQQYGTDGVEALGWTQVGDDKTIHVDISGLNPGNWSLSVQDAGGELLGWAGITIPDPADTAPTTTVGADQPTLVAQSTPLVGASDWGLIVGAIALVELVLIGTFLLHRRRT